jgi:hypothetical protein
MRASILFVGDEPGLLLFRGKLLQDHGEVTKASSWDRETTLASQTYDLIVLCQTVPEHVVILRRRSRLVINNVLIEHR